MTNDLMTRTSAINLVKCSTGTYKVTVSVHSKVYATST